MADKITLYAPIEKTDDEQRMVYGYASTEALDSQGEVVKKEAISSALADYMKFANIREMHQPSAVGKTKKATIDKKGMYIAAKVVDDKAWEKVKEGVYNGFSIGGRVKTMVDNEITNLTLTEISLVDRPANPEAVFDVFKLEDKETVTEKPAEEVETRVEEKVEEKPVEEAVTPEVPVVAEPVVPVEETPVVPATEEPKDEKKMANIKMRKSLYHVADLAVLIDKLHWLEECIEDEGKWEKDPLNAEHADKIVSAMKVLSDLLIEMARTETDEAMKEEEEETPVVAMADEPVSLKKQVEDEVKALKMPADELLISWLKSENLPTDEKSLGVMKYELAGDIIRYIEESRPESMARDAAAAEARKVQDSMPTIMGDYSKVVALVEKVEKELVKEDVVTAPVSPESPAEAVSEELKGLQRIVELLNSFNAGNALTDDEKKELANGLQAGSTFFGGGHIAEPNPSTKSDVETTLAKSENITKLEGEVTMLKGQIEKILAMPVAPKIKAVYVVERHFDESIDKSDQLTKAEKESDELVIKMKNDPNNTSLIKRAGELSTEIMNLRRELNK